MLLHFLVVEHDLEVSRESELARQVAQHALEETVNGLDAEPVVVVDEQGQRFRRPTADDTLGQRGEGLLHLIIIVVGIGQAMSDAIELGEDALLHLLRGFVGEGHGEGVLVVGRVLDKQLDVFHGKRKGLARAGRGFEDG